MYFSPPSLSFIIAQNSSFSVSYGIAPFTDSTILYSALESQLPGQVSYPKNARYQASIDAYFYQQARLTPRCIVFPKSASDVSHTVKIIAGMKGKAAVRGGGHTPVANVANIENGVTIDLSGMNNVRLKTAQTLGLLSVQNEAGSSASSSAFPAASAVPHLSNSSMVSDDVAPLSSSTILSTGGGATWGDVYQKLDPTGLISVGGRGTSLGVGGLITGG